LTLYDLEYPGYGTFSGNISTGVIDFLQSLLSTRYPWDIAGILKWWLGGTEDELPHFTLAIYQYGYGYGMQGSRGIYVATAILLIYVLVALIHIAIVIIGGWSSDAWSTPGDVIALAVNSSPTKLLQNTCAGIGDSNIWTHIVSVEETSEAHLEIMFEKQIGVRKEDQDLETRGIPLQQVQSNAGERVRKRVVSGKKYGSLAPRLDNE
jgi:hypothetical protein